MKSDWKIAMRPGKPIRYSAIRRVVAEFNPEDLEWFTSSVESARYECLVHGLIDDPIIGTESDDLWLICPWCSPPEVFKRWQSEEVFDS